MSNFEKWIPIEGEITDKNNVMFKINGEWTEPCSFDSYLGNQIEEVKQAKLFTCTNDIQIGNMINVEQDGYDYGTVIRFGKDNDCEIVWIKTNEGKEEDWVKSSVYKVIK